jgi:hypothetical protein
VIVLTIYSRPGCHLCDELKATVTKVATGGDDAVMVHEIDISTDSALEEAYGLEIPVLLANGRKVAKYRIAEDRLRRILAELTAQVSSPLEPAD